MIKEKIKFDIWTRSLEKSKQEERDGKEREKERKLRISFFVCVDGGGWILEYIIILG